MTEIGGRTVESHLGSVALERTAAMFAYGVLTPTSLTVFPLAQAAEALAVVEGGHAKGKVVIEVRAPRTSRD